jgi:hypothetical protein
MESKVLKSVEGSTLTFDDGSTLTVAPGVFVKLDGQEAALSALLPGDRVQAINGEDGKLSVLKVRRTTPDGREATTSQRETERRSSEPVVAEPMADKGPASPEPVAEESDHP